jgi:CubicO group peptidase (beta-lactamase class C family)
MQTLRRTSTLATLLAAVLAAGCGDTPTGPGPADVVDLTLPWETTQPAAVGVDARALDVAAARAQSIDRLRSLLVIRDGRVVLEKYYGGAGPDDLADVRSVTKSVVGTLTGIALERGLLTGLDETLGDLIPPQVAALRPDEQSITVGDLLTMTGGWTWDESTPAGYNDWILSRDLLGYLLARPLADPPGSVFTYNSAAAHLLGVVLEQATGMSLPAFADEVLFGPLGISQRAWENTGDGHVNGGAGLNLRPRDLARIGQLYLQRGVSGTTRVIPEAWVAQATAAHFPWTNDIGPTHVSYGYLWWTDADHDAYLAWGYRGQFIYVAPARHLVVVTTTAWWPIAGVGAPTDLDEQVLDAIINSVAPAAPVVG